MASFDFGLAGTLFGSNGRLGTWVALLSNATLEIKKCEKGEDDIRGTLVVSITAREKVDEMQIAIAPREHPKYTISVPPPRWRRLKGFG